MEASTETVSRTSETHRKIWWKKSRRNESHTKLLVGAFLAIFSTVAFVICMAIGVLFISLFYTERPLTSEDYEQWEVAESFPAVAQTYLPIYQEAGKKYGVPWQVLAGIHKIETDFGRNLSVSSVGARGHTQFMPKTWVGWSYPGGTRLGNLPDHVDITDPALIQKYGGYGVDANNDGKADPYDPVDAIHSTANYLSANYSPGEDWFARKGPVWNYNHDYENYVLKVKEYAESFAVPTPKTGAGSHLAQGAFAWPVPGGTLTDHYGDRFHPIKKVYRKHAGIDIGKGYGAPIVASDGGVVVESRKSSGYGWKVVIDHGNGFRTLYAHMEPQDVKVLVGQEVAQGDLIALMGSNGWSTGPHLHFEIHKNGQVINPESLVQIP